MRLSPGLVLLFAVACIRREPLPPQAAEPANQAPKPSPAVVPVFAVVGVDDPRTCRDQAPEPDATQKERESVTSEVERRVVELSGPLRACSARTSAEELDVEIDVGEAGTTTAAVRGATVAECSLVECVRRQLSGLQVAPPLPGRDVSVRRILSLGSNATVAFAANGARIAVLGEAPEKKAACFAPAAEPGPPSEQIRAIVRAQFGRFRSCFESGLGRNANLRGKVVTRFVIGLDGKVPNVSIADNELTDCQVVRCIRRVFSMLEFPPPKGGIVTVQYPIMLEPG